MKKRPKVSIVIATYNSEKLLPKVLESLRNQTYPQDDLEIIIVDGGSVDSTIAIAEKYACKVFFNPKTEPVNAKMIGIQQAEGKYLVTVDHDEVFENKNSIKLRVEALETHPECKAALCSGYKRPQNYPALNQYISEFGDPFSLFIYNCSKDYQFFSKNCKSKYIIKEETMDYFCVSFEGNTKPVLFELVCLGTMINLDYFKKHTAIETDSGIMTHLFYHMLENGDSDIIVSKDDPLLHYSVDSLKRYLPKLKWRICNNIHFQDMGESGFSGRMKYQQKIKYKKYLFVPYTISCFLPLFHGMYLAITRKNAIYMFHVVLCWYVLIQILYQYAKKLLCKTPEFKSYDGKKVIK